jgi:hypothetical protein
MNELSEISKREAVPGYPSDDNSTSEIPSGLNPEIFESPENIQVFPLTLNQELCMRLLNCSMFIKYSSTIDLIICMIYTLCDNEISGLLVSLPVFGYCGARYFHKGLVSIYSFYLLTSILYKLGLLLIENNSEVIIKVIAICIFRFALFLSTCYFIFKLNKIQKFERNLLRLASES